MFKKNITILLVFLSTLIYSQLSGKSEISIITIGPGENLYEKFGHTAIRIVDQEKGIDYIYNYGIFDTRQSNFYWNFTKGFMKYKLCKYSFSTSLYTAEREKRSMKEQIINLTQAEKNKAFLFLENNVKPENASYFYDPYFNNCATKPRDIIIDIVGEKLNLTEEYSDKKTLRELMNIMIHQNTWASFGINLSLGSKLDKEIKPVDYAYLPKYLFKLFESSTISNGNKKIPLVKENNTLLDFPPIVSESDKINPFIFFTILFLIVSLISYKDYKKNTRNKPLDFILLFGTGIVGCVIVFLWFFTNHSTAPYNFNFLWAFMPNLIIAFVSLKDNKTKWIRNYIKSIILFLLVIPIIWLTGIQKLNWTVIPLLISLLLRYSLILRTSYINESKPSS